MLKREQNSLIIFMGSYADLIPTPLNSVYGATKAFINSLSQTIKYETKESRVDISLIRPLYVRTRLSSFLPPTHFMLVSVEDFVKSAIKEIEKGNFMTNGHWKHRIIAKLIEHNDFLRQRMIRHIEKLNLSAEERVEKYSELRNRLKNRK